jgi:thiol-disulfide isomerase/thioredoxin
MKKLVLPACILGLLMIASLRAEPPREASEILKEYGDVKLPAVDAAKVKDPAYVRSYLEQRAEAVEKQNRLALELFRAAPDHPRAAALMSTRWANMSNGRDSAAAMAEMDQFLKDHPDSTLKSQVLYSRAAATLSNPQTASNPQKSLAAVEDFIQANPKDERGAGLLSMVAMRSRDKDEGLRLQKRIVADYPGSRAAKMAEGSIRRAEDIGKPFDLSFDDAIHGQSVSIKGLQGKIVVIDFWATWCGPCVAELPKMKELYAKYKEQGIEFIGVSLDQPNGGLEKLKDFVAENAIDWPQYFMGKGWDSEFSQSWGINSIPCVFIVDASGNLYSTEARGKLDQLVPELLKKRDG